MGGTHPPPHRGGLPQPAAVAGSVRPARDGDGPARHPRLRDGGAKDGRAGQDGLGPVGAASAEAITVAAGSHRRSSQRGSGKVPTGLSIGGGAAAGGASGGGCAAAAADGRTGRGAGGGAGAARAASVGGHAAAARTSMQEVEADEGRDGGGATTTAAAGQQLSIATAKDIVQKIFRC